ncbi:helix-turn-helix domain-containing protein [Kocuria salina]|uniref:helix-turn-helix domain-containing protein n=1 Tax=Kocuria salina TaxID=1929416 RepID=UPI00159470EB|nr:helix-turn-helix domain-containing protein [Kocuria salina]NVC24062.1 helix-turn-helix domain-containing protein [Kocuria salina]
MTAYQPPRRTPFHAVVTGLPAGVILRHLNHGEINAVRRTWQLQGLDSYVRVLDDALDQLKASNEDYNSRVNVGMNPEPAQRPREKEPITDPINTEQAAALLGRSAEWVRRLIREEHLIAERFGKGWILSRASVLAYRDARTGEAEAA